MGLRMGELLLNVAVEVEVLDGTKQSMEYVKSSVGYGGRSGSTDEKWQLWYAEITKQSQHRGRL